ncbi:MAG: low molecular weight phosphotyrosine protein phosphatase [Oscillospiraceae bacterium]|nr:low molecular weight phosphotyrosine protein phosphatase [Oscillospiraceae bacterium]
MHRIVFICHGNICRSPMAEFVLKDMVKKRGIADDFFIESRATSTEEIGNGVHHGTTGKLAQYGISTAGKTAIQLRKSDYEKYDMLICMDSWNVRNTMRIIGSDKAEKVTKLLSFAGEGGDIADPWYTGNFDETYDDVLRGCEGLLSYLGYTE